MWFRKRRGWEIPESEATPESVFRDRRRLAKAIAAGPILASLGALAACGEDVETAAAAGDPSASLYPVATNKKFALDRPLSDEALATSYNNFYEFGSHKKISGAAAKMVIRPWTVTFDGMVEKPFQMDIDSLLKRMKLEERLYRHRCVEAWSMAVPWSGFALADLVALAKPLAGAKFLRMETFGETEWAPGFRQDWYPWPYVEGLTMAEATNELAFIATGLYGKPIARQNGAPLRLAVPWKYGFKSIKSIVRFTFTDQRPKSFWEVVQGDEYGFWANVNPQVPHPRWSQETEQPLGREGRVPTLIFNGYGEWVSALYKGLESERLYV